MHGVPGGLGLLGPWLFGVPWLSPVILDANQSSRFVCMPDMPVVPTPSHPSQSQLLANWGQSKLCCISLSACGCGRRLGDFRATKTQVTGHYR